MAERLRLDPTACDGVGICAHLARELIRLDPWGYPVVAPLELAGRKARQARAAVQACPHRALYVDDE